MVILCYVYFTIIFKIIKNGQGKCFKQENIQKQGLKKQKYLGIKML